MKIKYSDLIELRNFFSGYLNGQKLTPSKKAKIESYISLLDRALKEKKPVDYKLLLLTTAQIAEILKIIYDFFT